MCLISGRTRGTGAFPPRLTKHPVGPFLETPNNAALHENAPNFGGPNWIKASLFSGSLFHSGCCCIPSLSSASIDANSGSASHMASRPLICAYRYICAVICVSRALNHKTRLFISGNGLLKLTISQHLPSASVCRAAPVSEDIICTNLVWCHTPNSQDQHNLVVQLVPAVKCIPVKTPCPHSCFQALSIDCVVSGSWTEHARVTHNTVLPSILIDSGIRQMSCQERRGVLCFRVCPVSPETT